MNTTNRLERTLQRRQHNLVLATLELEVAREHLAASAPGITPTMVAILEGQVASRRVEVIAAERLVALTAT